MASEMKVIPAVRKEDLSLHWINFNDITHISVEGGQLVYHTGEQSYFSIRTLEEFTRGLENEGFMRMDRASLVRMDKITYFDSEYGKVYFDQKPDKNSPFATVSYTIMKDIKRRLPEEKDLSRDSKN